MNVRRELVSLRAWLELVTPTELAKHLPQLDTKLHDLLGVVRLTDLEIYFAVYGLIYGLTASLKVSLEVLTKFNEISTLLFRLGVGGDCERSTLNLSDECALQFATAIERLLTNLPFCRQVFLQPDSMPIIAHTFSVVLGVLRNPQAAKPRLQALRAISALVEYTRPGDDLAVSWAIRASCLSKIFPGFSQCLFSTATGEKGRNSALKANALRVWASLVESCFGDKPSSCIENLSEEEFAKLDLSEFTQWRLDAASRIQPLIGKCMEVLSSNAIDLSPSAVELLDCAVVDFASKAYHKLRDDLICSLIIVAAKSHSPLQQGQMTENCKSASASASALLHLSRLSQSSIGPEYAANGLDYIRKLAFGVLLRSSSELNSLLDFATDGRICALLLNRICGLVELLDIDGLWCYTDKAPSGVCASQGATYPEELQPLLVQVLGLATGSGLLSATARQALFCISRRCGFSSFSDFISASSGPLISALTLDFHSVIIQAPLFEGSSGECRFHPPADICSRLETACRALTFFIEHANYEAIHRIRPLVMQMLMCLDVTYDFAAAHFLPVLTKIIRTCCRIDDDANHSTATPSTMVADPPTTSLPTTTASQSKVSFVELLEDRRKDKVLLSDCMDATVRATLKLLCDTRRQHSYAYESPPSSLVSVTDNALAQPPQKADLPDAQTSVSDDAPTLYPDQIRLVEEVMLRSIHLMSCDVPRLRIASMSLLCEGCCLLARHDDLLLPLVHKIWSPLLARMRDKNPAVVEKAFELFAVLANCSRTFIRSRASTDLMNTLVIFLERGASVSLGEPASYEFLTACRVQRRLLQTLGPLCVQLGLFAVSLRPVVQVLCTYLNTKQPNGLREAAAQSLLHLHSLDPGLVAYECDSQRGRGT
nr:unnamed protein product [Spirometra erinaceieuropaei]